MGSHWDFQTQTFCARPRISTTPLPTCTRHVSVRYVSVYCDVLSRAEVVCRTRMPAPCCVRSARSAGAVGWWNVGKADAVPRQRDELKIEGELYEHHNEQSTKVCTHFAIQISRLVLRLHLPTTHPCRCSVRLRIFGAAAYCHRDESIFKMC